MAGSLEVLEIESNRELLSDRQQSLLEEFLRVQASGDPFTKRSIQDCNFLDLVANFLIYEPHFENGVATDWKVALAGSEVTRIYGEITGVNLTDMMQQSNLALKDLLELFARCLRDKIALMSQGKEIISRNERLSSVALVLPIQVSKDGREGVLVCAEYLRAVAAAAE